MTDSRYYQISAQTGEGLSDLIIALTRFAETFFDSAEAAPITRLRQRLIIADLASSLHRVDADRPSDHRPDHPDSVELLAENLRLAVRAIGRLTGRIDVEEILDVIFRDFCIGK